MSKELIRIFDTTLRDGEQSPGCSMNLEEKMTLARQLERLGVDVIEAGFPIASEGDFESVRSVAAALEQTIVCGLARTSSADVERAAKALIVCPVPVGVDRPACLRRFRRGPDAGRGRKHAAPRAAARRLLHTLV